MATILLVEEDGLTAQRLGRALRRAGHTLLLARDGQAALVEARTADVVVLDLRLPDRPGEAVLADLKRQPATASLPVLVLASKAGAAAFLRAGRAEETAGLLLKPVEESDLLQAVNLALAAAPAWCPDDLAEARRRQSALIWRLIVEGPDPFVLQLCRRLSADRGARPRWMPSPGAPGWPELAQWAHREGLVDEEQARLLACVPLPAPTGAVKGLA